MYVLPNFQNPGGVTLSEGRRIPTGWGCRTSTASPSLTFPSEVKWTHPQGGLFLWVTLPTGVDCMRLFDEAIKHNVAFVPGQPFFAEGDSGSHMRLNFSNATPEMLREGIRRLSIAVAHQVEHRASIETPVTA